MSGDRRWRVRLTATAESDFRNILRWTAQRFGHAQARIYSETLTRAIKAQAQWIRITNGQGHAFLAKQGSHWRPVDSLKPLNVISKAPSARLDFPASADDPASVARYWRAFGDCQFLRGGDDYDRRFVLAVHRVLFDVPKTLPYSHGGVHILEERGSAWHNFGNRAGSYFTRYADFIAATEGRVEAVSVAVNRWHRGGLRLCVGVRKPNRTHHALQLDTDQCERAEGAKSWRIYHDGRMSQVPAVGSAFRPAGLLSGSLASGAPLSQLPAAPPARPRVSRCSTSCSPRRPRDFQARAGPAAAAAARTLTVPDLPFDDTVGAFCRHDHVALR